MQIDRAITVIALVVLLADIFFEEYFFGYNIPVMVLALVALIVSFFLRKRNGQKSSK